MARYGMVIDTRKCVGCTDCVVACKTENQVPEGFNRDWIASETTGRFPTPHLEIRTERCNHCDHPPCVSCCPTGASHVEPFGAVVLVTPEQCIGCKACLASCPYDARFVHPDGYADKCTFCIHRVKDGLDPACVSVCPTHCMTFGDLDDPNSAVSRLLAARPHHALLPAAGTGAQDLLSGVTMTDLVLTRHNELDRSPGPRVGLGDPGLPVPRRVGGRHDDHRRVLPAPRKTARGQLRVCAAAGPQPGDPEPRHGGAVPRPRAQALRLAPLHHLRGRVADVLGRLDPAARLPGARRALRAPAAGTPAGDLAGVRPRHGAPGAAGVDARAGRDGRRARRRRSASTPACS